MKTEINTLQDAFGKLSDALTCVNAVIKKRKQDPHGARNDIIKATASVMGWCDDLAKERDRRNDAIYGKGILRAKLTGGIHSREVTLQRPDNACEIPYIGEAAFNALAYAFGTRLLRSSAPFDIAVLSPSGRIVKTIQGKDC